ncbi:MAG: P-II family nitrogen regulator [Dethiobacteria bacterium]
MYLIVLVLNRVELLEDVLESLVQAGIRGATIIDSTGMGRTLAQADHEVSVLAGLRSIFQYSRPQNKTVFSVVETKEELERATTAIKEKLGDMTRPGVGILFSLKLGEAFGLAKEEL